MTQKHSFDTSWMLVVALLLCLGMLGITTQVAAGEGGGRDLEQLEAASLAGVSQQIIAGPTPIGLTPAEWESIQSQIFAVNEFAQKRSSGASYPIQNRADSWSHRHQVKLTSPDPAVSDYFGDSGSVRGYRRNRGIR